MTLPKEFIAQEATEFAPILISHPNKSAANTKEVAIINQEKVLPNVSFIDILGEVNSLSELEVVLMMLADDSIWVRESKAQPYQGFDKDGFVSLIKDLLGKAQKNPIIWINENDNRLTMCLYGRQIPKEAIQLTMVPKTIIEEEKIVVVKYEPNDTIQFKVNRFNLEEAVARLVQRILDKDSAISESNSQPTINLSRMRKAV